MLMTIEAIMSDMEAVIKSATAEQLEVLETIGEMITNQINSLQEPTEDGASNTEAQDSQPEEAEGSQEAEADSMEESD